MNTLRQKMIGADACRATCVVVHQVDDVVGDAPLQAGIDAPLVRRAR